MKCGKMVVISHFKGDGSHKWGIHGSPEGHLHMDMVLSYPEPTDETKTCPLFFSFLPLVMKLFKLGHRRKPGCQGVFRNDAGWSLFGGQDCLVPKGTVSRRSLIPDHLTPELCSSRFVASLPVISTRCHENSYKKL